MTNKKRNLFWGIALVLAAIITLWMSIPSKVPQDVSQATITQPPSEVQDADFQELTFANNDKTMVSKEASVFEFEGFALDGKKSHVGSFNDWDASLIKEEGVIIGVQGTIQADSVMTDSERLDGHLKNDDFFDVENYPTIEFTSTSVTDDAMTGDLTFHGVTNEITFPITLTENSITAEFLLDTTPFNIKYTGINKDVRMNLVFSE